jgi:endogenous inhibitor of DNA gyrase (YacG/DUF329 family)
MPRPSEPAAAAGGRGSGAKGGGDRGEGGKGKDGSGGQQGRGNTRSCPICGKPSQQATRPFCSKRCRDVDLNRWLSGSYVVPGSESEDEGSE